MAARVKLCAIAKDEGAYLADWVFHHLHLGFDAVEVWVNDTTDDSPEILRRISAAYPQVRSRNVDRLLEECLARGEHFQRRAYQRMARRSRRQGFTHVAFLDLDEFWVPADLAASIHSFVPEDPTVKVVSFPWCADVPDATRQPFASPLGERVALQMDRHVKSLVRLDGSVRSFREHTARLRRGGRLLVRDRFPLVDPQAQRRGAFVTDDYLVQHWDVLPEAFVLHAMNRSPVEYVAGLTKGLRQTGMDIDLKPNRYGYVPTPAPVLTFEPPARSWRAYARAHRRFRRRTGVDDLVRRAEALATSRSEELLGRVAVDDALAGRLAGALHGVPVPGHPAQRGVATRRTR